MNQAEETSSWDLKIQFRKKRCKRSEIKLNINKSFPHNKSDEYSPENSGYCEWKGEKSESKLPYQLLEASNFDLYPVVTGCRKPKRFFNKFHDEIYYDIDSVMAMKNVLA